MPLVTMATPIAASEIYLLPDPDLQTETRIRKRDKRQLVLNILQLTLTCTVITLYSLGTNHFTLFAGDSLISAFFGASIMFFCTKLLTHQTERNKVFLNILFGVFLIIIALILIPLIMMLQDAVTSHAYYINLKLSAGIICLLVGILCFVEAII